jgi:hypothetical protein
VFIAKSFTLFLSNFCCCALLQGGIAITLHYIQFHVC